LQGMLDPYSTNLREDYYLNSLFLPKLAPAITKGKVCGGSNGAGEGTCQGPYPWTTAPGNSLISRPVSKRPVDPCSSHRAPKYRLVQGCCRQRPRLESGSPFWSCPDCF